MPTRKPTRKPLPPDAPFPERLGERIRAIREKKGKSQMDLVRHHEWSLGHIGKIERGEVDARATTLKRLADDLGVPMAKFFEGL